MCRAIIVHSAIMPFVDGLLLSAFLFFEKGSVPTMATKGKSRSLSKRHLSEITTQAAFIAEVDQQLS